MPINIWHLYNKKVFYHNQNHKKILTQGTEVILTMITHSQCGFLHLGFLHWSEMGFWGGFWGFSPASLDIQHWNSLQLSLLSGTSELTTPLGCRLGAPNPASSSSIIWSGKQHQSQRITPLFLPKQTQNTQGKATEWHSSEWGIRLESEFREQDVQQGPIHNNHQIQQNFFPFMHLEGYTFILLA